MPAPRVAVVGGGLSGALCGLGLKAHGVLPVVFDAGRGPGGRLSSGGAQFFFAESSRFRRVVEGLRAAGLAERWQGRFGVLGGQGGFLPVETIRQATGNRPDLDSKQGSDFCGFLQSSGELFVGTPSNTSLCARVLEMAGVELRQSCQVIEVSVDDPAAMSWRVDYTVDGTVDSAAGSGTETFDAVVFATHNPALAGDALSSAVQHTDDPDIAGRLDDLQVALTGLRESRRPAYALTATFPAGSLTTCLPFDAAMVPNSQIIRFIASEASKPGAVGTTDGDEHWTAISTPDFAAAVLEPGDVDMASAAMATELARLVAPFYGAGCAPCASASTAKRWGSAFTVGNLESWSRFEEESVSLAPYKLAICGDFIRGHPCPIEAAALSGMEAGERVGAWFAHNNNMHQ